MSESQNIEYKQGWRDEYLKWICGFANATGVKFISVYLIVLSITIIPVHRYN